MMRGLAMFDNGTSCEVEASLYLAREAFEGPVETQIVSASSPALKNSARLGATAAFNTLLELGLIDPQQRRCVAFCFVGEMAPLQIVGTSAGLLFAVMFAGQLLEEHQKLAPAGFTIAATGEVASLNIRAPLKAVDGVPAKITAALNVLKRGDQLLYPAASDDQVSDALRKQAEDQGVRLLPVSTVREALTTALGLQPSASYQEPSVPQAESSEGKSRQLRPLTALDIEALRQARVVFIEWDRDDAWGRDCGCVTCYGLPPEIDPSLKGYSLLAWSGVEGGTTVREEARSEFWEPRQATARITWRSASNELLYWYAMAESCQPGDLLHLRWGCDRDTTPELRQAGFIIDTLDILIERGGEDLALFRLVTRIVPRDGPHCMFGFTIHKFRREGHS
jgi:hypothetical protein